MLRIHHAGGRVLRFLLLLPRPSLPGQEVERDADELRQPGVRDAGQRDHFQAEVVRGADRGQGRVRAVLRLRNESVLFQNYS